eukprot:COSAG02_NODE_8381_length_2591_cov_2.181380_1_plen_47_part_00
MGAVVRYGSDPAADDEVVQTTSFRGGGQVPDLAGPTLLASNSGAIA